MVFSFASPSYGPDSPATPRTALSPSGEDITATQTFNLFLLFTLFSRSLNRAISLESACNYDEILIKGRPSQTCPHSHSLSLSIFLSLLLSFSLSLFLSLFQTLSPFCSRWSQVQRTPEEETASTTSMCAILSRIGLDVFRLICMDVFTQPVLLWNMPGGADSACTRLRLDLAKCESYTLSAYYCFSRLAAC